MFMEIDTLYFFKGFFYAAWLILRNGNEFFSLFFFFLVF